MRLTAPGYPSVPAAIAAAARGAWPDGTQVWLFGSRTDDQARGGDIDLLIETPYGLDAAEVEARRTRFLARLYADLDEQRIDVVVTAADRPDPRPIVQAARRQAVLLLAGPGARARG